MSKLLDKISYYKKLGSWIVKAGWDTRTKNRKGQFPCAYMKINELGSRNIPPRPVMRLTSRKNRATWQRMLRKGMEASVPMSVLTNQVGSRMRSDIQESITSNIPPPNAPGTVRAKARRNNNGGTLRDTLFALQQVTYVAEKKGK